MGLSTGAVRPTSALADILDAALPQTQCTRCGFPDCRGYADGVALGAAPANRCPPGGEEGVHRLARLAGRPVLPLDPAHGVEGPRLLATIEEADCIGCTLCIQACPVDCIVGAPKRMHTVVANQCTGCELCVPACPVDCIVLAPVSGERTGWQAWSAEDADAARARYHSRQARQADGQARRDAGLGAASPSTGESGKTRPVRSAVVEAAMARARAARAA